MTNETNEINESNDMTTLPKTCDVVIIGGGPSGLAAATRLKERGVGSVHVLEREHEAGGIPRHCGHSPFGMREFKNLLTGPAYAARLIRQAKKVGVQIHTNTSVVGLHEGGRLTLTTDRGESEIVPRRVILSTGVRETPRAPRFVSGQRPLGVLTTGALQSMVNLQKTVPFRWPVIIGSELVSFSALLTCRLGGMKPVAMIEQQDRITARSFCRLLPMLMGVPLHLNSQVVEILGKDRVSAIRLINSAGQEQTVACDGVVFTGQFTPESSLLRMAHLAVDQASGGPVIDQFGRCSDPAYFATGNLLRPVETAGWCWQEGCRTGNYVAAELANERPDLSVSCDVVTDVVTRGSLGSAIKFVIPQVLSLPLSGNVGGDLQLRFNKKATGLLSVRCGEKIIWSRYVTVLPERRMVIPFSCDIERTGVEPLEVCFDE